MAPTVYPLLVKTLVDFFNTDDSQALLNCFVASQVSNSRPVRYVALFSVPVGGPERANVLSTRRVTAQVSDESEFLAGTLAETVRGLFVESRYKGLGIKRCQIIGEPARFPGPGLPNRWQVTADFLIRAKASLL